MNTNIPQVDFISNFGDSEIEGMWHQLEDMAHSRSYNAGWWHDPKSGLPLLDGFPAYPEFDEAHNSLAALFPYIIATKLHLVTTEISEATEGFRTDAMDDKLSHRPQIECELADAVLRILDVSKALNLDVIGALLEKSQFNTTRPDHAIANRLKPGGKKF